MKNTIYSDWAIDTVMELSNLFDWNPSNFLNTADKTMMVSLGYDWVYDELTDA